MKKYNILFVMYSFLILLYRSWFSPISRQHFPVDPSIYLTIGRGIAHGFIPYKDLLDIKGPLIFFIYCIGSYFHINTIYYGIYIIEGIILSISLAYIYKTICLFSKKKILNIILTCLYPLLLTWNGSFLSGGEAEEFVLPAIIYLLYKVFSSFINKDAFCYKDYFIEGLLCSYVFWIKYTLLGPWIVLFLCLLYKNLKKHDIKKTINVFLVSFFGFMLLTIPVIAFFYLNSGIDDLLWGYFGWNLKYGDANGIFIKKVLFAIFHSFTLFMKTNPILWIFTVVIPLLTILFINIISNRQKIFLFLVVLTTLFLELYSGVVYPYYQLIAIPFSLISFIGISYLWNRNHFYGKIVTLLATVSCFYVFSLSDSNQENDYSYRDRFIKKMEDSAVHFPITLLDCNELDSGWYNALNILPPTKYFNKMNIHSGKNFSVFDSKQLNIIKNKKVEFIIYPVKKNEGLNTWTKLIAKNYYILDKEKINGKQVEWIILGRRKSK